MTVRQAAQPYMRHAEDEMPWLEEGNRIHDLLVDTSRRVADNEGASQALIDALEGVTAAHRALTKTRNAMVLARAIEMWLRDPEAGGVSDGLCKGCGPVLGPVVSERSTAP